MRPATRYKALAIIFLASLISAVAFFHFFPVGVIGELAAVPAIGALFGALFQLGRDSIQHDRAIQLEERKNRFTVGATSHMADVAFDKHVLFCEEYSKEVYVTLAFLFRKGPHQDVLERANALADIRTKWAVWLTPELEEKLISFEGALHRIGANAWLLGELRADEDRSEPIKEAYGTFAAVMGWETFRGETVTRGLAAEKVVEGLRKVLGTAELSRLRSELVKRAME